MRSGGAYGAPLAAPRLARRTAPRPWVKPLLLALAVAQPIVVEQRTPIAVAVAVPHLEPLAVPQLRRRRQRRIMRHGHDERPLLALILAAVVRLARNRSGERVVDQFGRIALQFGEIGDPL